MQVIFAISRAARGSEPVLWTPMVAAACGTAQPVLLADQQPFLHHDDDRVIGQAVAKPKKEDIDEITDHFNINAGNPVQCLTQALPHGRTRGASMVMLSVRADDTAAALPFSGVKFRAVA